MLGKFQLLCQFHPNSGEYCNDFYVSMYRRTFGSEYYEVGLVRMIVGAKFHTMLFFEASFIFNVHSTCVQSQLGLSLSEFLVFLFYMNDWNQIDYSEQM